MGRQSSIEYVFKLTFRHAQMLRRVLLACFALHLPLTISAHWNTAATMLPPVIPFVSLLNQTAFNHSGGGYAYDNTTCAGRCCRRVEVARAPDAACVADWRACARLSRDSTAPRCGAGAPFPCAAWVPCDRQGWPEGVMPLMGLTVVACVVACAKCLCLNVHDNDLLQSKLSFDISVVLALVILGAFYSSAIVVALDYEQFEAHTETNLDFVSYQHCVEACNRFIPWDTDSLEGRLDTYQTFYCRDATYNVSGLALFPANRNQRPGGSTCPTSWYVEYIWQTGYNTFHGWYCSSCFERRDEWRYLHDLSRFNRVRGYVFWIVLLVMAYAGLAMDSVVVCMVLVLEKTRWDQCRPICRGLVWFMGFLAFLSCVGHVGCLIADCIYMHALNFHPGINRTNDAVNRFDVYGFCAGSVVMDLVGVLLLAALLFSCMQMEGWMEEHTSMADMILEYTDLNKKKPDGMVTEQESTPLNGGPSARLGGMRIKPSDVVRVAKDRMV